MNVRAPMRTSAFRAVWSAGLVSETGDWLLLVALPVVVYELTGSALGTSVALVVELLPGIVLAPVASWCADRWDRRRLLAALSLVQGTCLLPLLAVHDRAGLPVVYAVILVEAALLALFEPSKNALLPTLVPRDDLVAANSLIGLAQNAARLVGGPVGGLLLAAGGLRWVVVVDLVSYLAAALLLAGGRRERSAARRRRTGRDHIGTTAAADPTEPRGVGGALRVVVGNRPVRDTLSVTFLAQIAQGMFVVLFVVFVEQRLRGGAAEIGLLRGVQAVGAVAGGVALTVLARRWRPAVLTAVALLAFGGLSLLIWNAPAWTDQEGVYIALFALVGAPGIVLLTGLISSLQNDAPAAAHARVFSAFGLVDNAGQIVGMVAAGLLTAAVGLSALLDVQSAFYLGAGVLAASRLLVRRGTHPTQPGVVTATATEVGARLRVE